ncbi:MAG: DoxX family protein [Acidobacteria bacterium]|nr:DoxX family protein [Acidobacteriota bacterium]
MFEKLFARYGDHAHALMRIVFGLLFWMHGAQKLFGMFGGEMPALLSLRGVAGIIEFFGGLAIALGLFTRPVAFLCSGEMAAAYFISHFPRGFWPLQNQGERAALFCFAFLMMVTVGAKKWSLDALMQRNPRK